MFDRCQLRQAWNHTHQEKPASEQPEAEVVAFAEHLRQQLQPGISVLDAGCGRGRNVFYLSQVGFTAYACDLSQVAIAVTKVRAQQAGIAASFLVADLTDLPYADNLFTAVICVHVLPYRFKADIVRSVCELRRILQPNGWLYFDLLGCDDAEFGCGQELEKHTFLDSSGMPIHFSSRREVDELLKGFAVERMTRLELGSPTHRRVGWMVWAMKCEEC